MIEGMRRRPTAASSEAYDLIVVGGGIYGAMIVLEAARRGLRPLLLERDDYGGATSWNSHRIVHGGLRYLQRLDLRRFQTSVRERSWFLRHFPDLVEPLPCLMPLYGRGARRPSVLRAALIANDLLSRHRNDGLRSDRRLESGGVMTVLETKSLFPSVRGDGLRGGALWYDAVMKDSQRLLIEVLRWACTYGARCLNYVEATGLSRSGGRATGIEAVDRVGGRTLRFEAGTVVNCAGPWSGALAAAFDREIPGLFRPSLAFNLLLDREPPSEVAVAVSAPRPGAHTWFLYPRRGRLYAGTAHFPCTESPPSSTPSEEQIDAVIDDMNTAIPGVELRRHQVLRVYSGLLPATATASAELTSQPVIHDHAGAGGTAGLFSVSGVKYTTARDVAEQTLRRAFADLPEKGDETPRPEPGWFPDLSSRSARSLHNAELAVRLRDFAGDEAVVHIDDLLLRRGDAIAPIDDLADTGRRAASLLGWPEERIATEMRRLGD